MSALSRFILRPLAFPSHRWCALVDLSTGRVVALQRAGDPSPAADIAASGGHCPPLGRGEAVSRTSLILACPASAGGNASPSRVATVERLRPALALVS